MRRLAKFAHSVIPSDPVQLVFLMGVVCFTISPHMQWGLSDPNSLSFGSSYASNGNQNQNFWNLYTFFVPGSLLIVFAAASGYLSCFRPTKRPVANILWLVVLPVCLGLAFICGSYLYFSFSIHASVLENDTFAYMHLADIRNVFGRLGPGFRVCLLGLALVLVFISRMVFKIAALPLSLPHPIYDEVEGSPTWGRFQVLI